MRRDDPRRYRQPRYQWNGPGGVELRHRRPPRSVRRAKCRLWHRLRGRWRPIELDGRREWLCQQCGRGYLRRWKPTDVGP